MISEITKQQAFAVLVENSASIHGLLPEAIDGLSPDYTGPDGVPDGLSDPVGSNYTIFNSLRATDKSSSRLTAVSNIAQTWGTVFTRASIDNGVRSGFGVWTFGGSTSELLSTVPGDAQWAYSPEGARGTADALLNVAQSKSSASTYRSIISVIEDEDKFGQFGPEDEKILTVIVDGPDDYRLTRFDAQAVIAAANAAGVRIFIVHFDPLLTVRTASDGTPLIPDVPRYLLEQDTPCDPSDANACKDFEACRTVTTFANNPNTKVTLPAGKLLEPDNKFTDSYCAIEYTFSDEEQTQGRIGPISDYSEIACATGGGYLYFPSREKLADGNGTIAKLPLALDSLWEGSGRGERV